MRSHAHERTRATTPVHLLLALSLLCSAVLVALQASPADASAGQKCIDFEFHYVDGDGDSGQLCTTGGVGSIINVTSANVPSLHVTSLHISCSDTFDVEVRDGSGTLTGYASNGHSDLDGHLVAPHPTTGEPWYSITKDWADDCTSAPVPTYSLSILKEISVDGGATWADANDPTSADTPAVLAGSTVRYRITVTNTGSGDLTGVAIDDNRVDTCDGTIASLPVTDPIWTCEFDATAGSNALENTATARATSPLQTSLSDSDDANYTVRDPDPVYGLDLVKHVSTDGTTWFSGEAADDDHATATTGIPAVDEGDTVHFRITVTSTDDPLSLVSLTDALYDLGALNLDAVTTDDCSETDTVSGGALSIVALSSSWTCRFSVVAGASGATNTATASSLEEQTPAASDTAAYTVNPPTGEDDPSIRVVKTPSVTTAVVGDTVTYTYVVTNTGDVTLTDVTADDDLLGAVTLAATTLAPGASTSGSLSHTVVEADLPGPITNVVTATGTPPAGDDVSDQDEASVTLTSDPSIALTKEADTDLATVGDTITYTYVVTNTGHVTLTDVTLEDDPLGSIVLNATTLAPGASTTATATHVVNTVDLAAGVVINTAVTTGMAPDGTVVDAEADESVEVQGVQGIVVERPDPPGPPAPAPAPDPVSPTELPRTGLATESLAFLAFGVLALGALLLTPGRQRRVGAPAGTEPRG